MITDCWRGRVSSASASLRKDLLVAVWFCCLEDAISQGLPGHQRCLLVYMLNYFAGEKGIWDYWVLEKCHWKAVWLSFSATWAVPAFLNAEKHLLAERLEGFCLGLIFSELQEGWKEMVADLLFCCYWALKLIMFVDSETDLLAERLALSHWNLRQRDCGFG